MYYNNRELYHWGILGMKWGRKNGPPYPLKDGQKSSAEKKYEEMDDDEKAAHKERVRKSGSAKEVLKNKDIFDNNELQQIVNRINMEQQLSRLAADEEAKKKGKSFVDKAISSADKATKIINTGTNLYSAVDKAVKLIDSKEKEKKEKEKEKKEEEYKPSAFLKDLYRDAGFQYAMGMQKNSLGRYDSDKLKATAADAENFNKILKAMEEREKWVQKNNKKG